MLILPRSDVVTQMLQGELSVSPGYVKDCPCSDHLST